MIDEFNEQLIVWIIDDTVKYPVFEISIKRKPNDSLVYNEFTKLEEIITENKLRSIQTK